MTEQRAQQTQQLLHLVRNNEGMDEKIKTFIMNALGYSHHIIEVSLNHKEFVADDRLSPLADVNRTNRFIHGHLDIGCGGGGVVIVQR
jgi:hypothetical protein